jgi:hypothetical protein
MATTPSGDGPRLIAVSNPLFRLLLGITFGVLLVSLIGMALLAIFGPKEATEAQRQFATMCETGFKMTLGALLGLVGGRSSGMPPDRVEQG